MKHLDIAGRLALSFLVSIGFVGRVDAQRPPPQLDAAGILHRLRELQVLGSVLYVAAHPDDENTRLISYLANGRQVRTAYLSITRGGGGQNLIGSELGDGLGILRTQELLEARRLDGGEQFFTRAVDFGYSKDPEETFAKWGREEVLGDVVRAIRQFRPDVIITRFDTDGSGGHGHHTASAILAREAFELAADPSAFPEQLAEGLETWQARRLFFNGSTWWRSDLAAHAAKDPAHWVTVDVGGFDPLLGLSYTELAGRSRSQHKSQGFGAAEARGESLEYLRLDRGPACATPDLLDGIELGFEHVHKQVQALIDSFRPEAPELSVPGLSALARTLDALAESNDPERAWARSKAEATRRLILQACGAVIEVTTDVSRAASGDTLKVTVSALQRRPGTRLTLEDVVAPGAERTAVGKELTPNKPVVVEVPYKIERELTVDQPYWLTPAHAAGIEPESRATSTFTTTLKLPDGLAIRVARPLTNKWVDRVAGERTRPVVITPVASVRVVDPVAIVRAERTSVPVEVEALRDDVSGALQLSLPAGFSLEAAPAPIEKLKRGERRTLDLVIRRAPGALEGKVHVAFTGPLGSADSTLHVIDYPHIQPQTWYTPAEVTLVPLDIAVDVATVGFIDGAGDDVSSALRRLGIAIEHIDPASARLEDLAKCDAIVTGIRAYNTVRSLARFQSLLLMYVEKGGTLLVQYNTAGSDLVMSAKAIGPYPFSITRDRVTVEEAAPTFLAPAHPLLRTPNVIGPADFEGWVQERGLYFAGDLDPHYTALIAWNDPDDKPSNGALIACDYGKGRFIYTGLSLFRQLPAGVPGAYRLLANLISRRTPRE
jgi:LmbE family N-acetylglucosaminyl deacetylase